jgi:hypothetical protein
MTTFRHLFASVLATYVLAAGGIATAQLQTVQIGENKASATGVLAKLKNPGRVAKAVNPTLANLGLQSDPEFTCEIVPGLTHVVINPGVRKAAINDVDVLRICKDLMASGLYDYVEPDFILTALQSTPTDTAYADGTLWGIRNTGAGGGTAGIDVNATPAWSLTPGGSRDIVVAVIDTGIRYTHQDLKNNMWVNPGETAGNGVDDDGNGVVDDVFGLNAITNSGNPMDDNNHGTHCAGTIAATANDSGPIVGVAYNVRLMACKFLSAGGSGQTSDAVECVDYATRMGAQISSNSWGGGGSSQAMLDVIRAANAAGSLFVAAAGNASSNNDTTPTFPANYDSPNVVSVAAIDRNGALASFSNFGRTKVHVGAPGVAVYSSTRASDTSYASFSGTSMACPHAAGVAALLKSRSPSLTPTQLRERLVATARPLASLNGRTISNGMVDARAALLAGEDGTLDLAITSSAGSIKAGASVAFYVAVTDGGPITGATVTASIGAEAPVTCLDNGVSPDVAAGDAVYTGTFVIPASGQTVTVNARASKTGKQDGTASASFNVIAPPLNDLFENRIVLAIGSTQTTGNNRNAGSQPNEPLNPSIAGGQSVWWEWNAATSGSATITTAGSNYDTTLAIYTGAGTLASLSLVGANDDTNGHTSSVTFDATAGAPYYIQVDGYRGAQGDVRLNYPSPGQASGPPFITTQPASAGLVEGDPLAVSVAAGGTLPITFQWFKNGVPISGATGTSYNRPSVVLADAGNYTVTVTNPFGNVTSQPAVISVDPISVRPANDRFVNAQVLSGSAGSVTGSNSRASGEADEPDHASNSRPLESVWYRWTAPVNGVFTADTYGSSFDTTLALYTGSQVNALTQIAANDDAGNLQSFLTANVTAGQTYSLAVDGTQSAEGLIQLNFNLQPTVPGIINDHFVSRTILGGSSLTVSGNNMGASGETLEPEHTPTSIPTHSVWWAWTAPVTGVAVVDTQGSDFDTSLGVYTGTNVTALNRIGSNEDSGGPQSQVTFNCTAGTSYAIAVDGNGPAQGNILLNIVSGSTAPEIVVEQPAGTNLVDDSATVNFGTALNTRTATRTFTIKNTGASGLTGLRLRLSGQHASDFTVTATPVAPVVPNGSTTFTLAFQPADAGARNASLQILSNDANENPFDIALTGIGVVVPPDIEFRITTLDSKGAQVVDATSLIGDDHFGIAVSGSRLFVNGDTAAARFEATNLSGGAGLGRKVDGLCSDIGTGKLYTLAHNGTAFVAGNTTVSQLIELDGTTGSATTNIIALASPITIGTNSGLFSGNGRIVLHNGTNVFDIRVPSGAVIDLGPMTRPNWLASESWAVSGVAEFFGGKLYIAYRVSGAQRIDRMPVPSGTAQPVATFTNLGDMANWTISISQGRWYFNHEGASQFGGTGTTNEYAGFADATFQTLPPPTITSPRLASVYSGQAFSYQITASPEVTGYGANGLPTGLSLNPSTGLMTGSVLSPGSYVVTLSATNAAGTGTAPLTINVQTMPASFFEDFDPDTDRSLWDEFSGGAQANRFARPAGDLSSGNSLWFGGAGSRHATTIPLDTRTGGRVSFLVALGNGSRGRWEQADPGEEVVVEYSVNGAPFVAFGTPAGSSTWEEVEFDLPTAAEAFGTRLRFRQRAHTGRGLDHFAIDNVRFGPVVILAPEIAVEQPAGTGLVDGAATVSFPETERQGEASLTFTVRNLGLAALTGVAVQIDGAHAADYQVTAPPENSVAPAGSTAFTVRFSPSAYGIRTATLRISSNDANENPFDIALRGPCVDPLEFYDDFDPSYKPGLWLQFGGQVSANNRGANAGSGSTGNSLHFDGAGSRHATTKALDTRGGGFLSFKVALANSTAPLWESPDPEEEIVVEYSLNGTTFVSLAGPYTNRTWQAVSLPLPAESRSATTHFRFRQLSHSGPGLDHWAIEEVQVSSTTP